MSEAENILQTIKATVQNIVASDVRELKVKMSSLAGRMSSLEDSMKLQFEAMKNQSEAQFRALLAAIARTKAETVAFHPETGWRSQ